MQPETILVVDDDEATLDFCGAVLTEGGYRVLKAASGLQALEAFRNGEPIDLALVDVVMPEMTGIELVKLLETLGCCPKVSLISGYSPDEVRRLIGQDGSSYRIFWKPFDVRIFLQMIRNVLDAPQREIALSAGR